MHSSVVPSSTGLCQQGWDWKDPPLHGAAGLELGLHPTWAGLIAIKNISALHSPHQGHSRQFQCEITGITWSEVVLNKQASSHSRAQGSSMCRSWWLCRSYLGSVKPFSFPSHLAHQCSLFPCEFPHSCFIQVFQHFSVQEQGNITILTGCLRLMSKLCKWVILRPCIGAHWWMQKALVHISIKNQ